MPLIRVIKANASFVRGKMNVIFDLLKKQRSYRFAAVTTFNKQGYERYGENFLRCFEKFWPAKVDLLVYAEGVSIGSLAANILELDQEAELKKLMEFKERHHSNKFANGINPLSPEMEKSFRWDAVRFSNKVFAVCDAIYRTHGNYDHLIWLDADIVTHRLIPLSFLSQQSPSQNELAAYLNRVKAPECGWVGYNLNHPEILSFARAFEDVYLSDAFLQMRESHDSFVFWELVKRFQKEKKVRFKHLGSRRASGHIFINSALGRYMDHLKGNRKELGHSKPEDLKQKRTEAWWRSLEQT